MPLIGVFRIGVFRIGVFRSVISSMGVFGASLVATSVHAEEAPSTAVSDMITCDVAAKMPVLATLTFFGARSAGRAIFAGGDSFFDSRKEERFFLASVGVASFGHAMCGPVAQLAHKNPLAALESAGLRLGLPALVLAFTVAPQHREHSNELRFGSGPLGSVAGGILLSAAIVGGFALDFALVADAGQSQRRRTTGEWKVTIDPSSHGALLGVHHDL